MGTMMFVLLTVLAVCNGMDVYTKLQQVPMPIKGYQIDRTLGRWFVQFRKPPCSWSTSSEFTDSETNEYRAGKDSVIIEETFRNDMCHKVVSRIYFTSTPGVFKYKYPLGNVYSGSSITPATDYKTFHILYGCTKMSVFGDKCDDPWMVVRTRMIFPGKKVIAMINQALMSLWGITVDQLQPVQRIQSCNTKAPYRGKKMYSSNKPVPF